MKYHTIKTMRRCLAFIIGLCAVIAITAAVLLWWLCGAPDDTQDGLAIAMSATIITVSVTACVVALLALVTRDLFTIPVEGDDEHELLEIGNVANLPHTSKTPSRF
jgi:hypothetical protein